MKTNIVWSALNLNNYAQNVHLILDYTLTNMKEFVLLNAHNFIQQILKRTFVKDVYLLVWNAISFKMLNIAPHAFKNFCLIKQVKNVYLIALFNNISIKHYKNAKIVIKIALFVI